MRKQVLCVLFGKDQSRVDQEEAPFQTVRQSDHQEEEHQCLDQQANQRDMGDCTPCVAA